MGVYLWLENVITITLLAATRWHHWKEQYLLVVPGQLCLKTELQLLNMKLIKHVVEHAPAL